MKGHFPSKSISLHSLGLFRQQKWNCAHRFMNFYVYLWIHAVVSWTNLQE